MSRMPVRWSGPVTFRLLSSPTSPLRCHLRLLGLQLSGLCNRRGKFLENRSGVLYLSMCRSSSRIVVVFCQNVWNKLHALLISSSSLMSISRWQLYGCVLLLKSKYTQSIYIWTQTWCMRRCTILRFHMSTLDPVTLPVAVRLAWLTNEL